MDEGTEVYIKTKPKGRKWYHAPRVTNRGAVVSKNLYPPQMKWWRIQAAKNPKAFLWLDVGLMLSSKHYEEYRELGALKYGGLPTPDLKGLPSSTETTYSQKGSVGAPALKEPGAGVIFPAKPETDNPFKEAIYWHCRECVGNEVLPGEVCEVQSCVFCVWGLCPFNQPKEGENES